MDLRIDEKGKYFTPRIAKESLDVVVRTAQQLIVGQTHIRPDKRLKDEMNDTHERYLAMTGASVYAAPDGRLLFQTNFMLVAHAHIESVTPLAAIADGCQEAWFQAHRAMEENQE